MDYDVIKKLEQEISEENYRINNQNYSKHTRVMAESYLSGMIDTIKLMGYEVHDEKIIQRSDYGYEIDLEIL